ncbi:MAG: hypothetical protein R2702_18460 [Acidimicrobiales bacterium]
MTSISAITVRAALFQRRSRAGWLEELDGIREEALVAPDGPVDDVVAAGDIWTDLREGGVYADPTDLVAVRHRRDPRPAGAQGQGRQARPPEGSAQPRRGPEAAPEPAPAPPAPAATELPPPPAADPAE